MHTQTVDTAKFNFGTNFLVSYDKAYLRYSLSKRKDKKGKPYSILVFKEKEHPTLFPGINYLKIDNTLGTVTVVVSAKILLGNYWRKISLTTLRQVFENLHTTGLVTLTNIERLTQDVLMPASHPCIDFLGCYMPNAGKLLKILHQRKDYELADYKDSNSNSVNFEKLRSSAKAQEYGRLYNKILEFRMPENAAFRAKLTPEELGVMLSYFSTRTRAEIVLGCSAKSREYYNIPEKEPLTAVRLLSADINPVYCMFKKFMKEVPTNFTPTLVPERSSSNSLKFYFTTKLTEKEIVDFYYLDWAGFNLDKIRYILRQKHIINTQKPRPASVTDKMKKLEVLNARWEAFKAQVTQEDFQILAAMMEAIRNGNNEDQATPSDAQIAIAA